MLYDSFIKIQITFRRTNNFIEIDFKTKQDKLELQKGTRKGLKITTKELSLVNLFIGKWVKIK